MTEGYDSRSPGRRHNERSSFAILQACPRVRPRGGSAYRFGRVTYITRLPLAKSMTVFTPGHLSAEEVEAVVRGDNPWMLE